MPIVNDETQESGEIFTVTLSGAVNAVVGDESKHIYGILDEDTYGAIRLSAVRYSVSESGPLATITAPEVGGTDGEAKVNVIWIPNRLRQDGVDYGAPEPTGVSLAPRQGRQDHHGADQERPLSRRVRRDFPG